MDPKAYEAVTLILAIGSLILPMVFGYVVFKMTRIFVTKEEFQAWKESAKAEKDDLKTRLLSIESNTTVLLQRTARMRMEDENGRC